MSLTTKALIIQEQKVGEKDRLVTVLSESQGIFKAFVNGAMSMKSKNHAGTAFLSYSFLTVYKGKDTYTINESDIINGFFKLRTNIVSVSLASYFCELARFLAPREEPAGDYLKVLLNALYLLGEQKRSGALIKGVVELKFLALCGYMPDLVACSKCGTYDGVQMYLSLQEAKLTCVDCATLPENGSHLLSSGILAAMRHIIYSQDKMIFNFNLSDEGLESLSDLTEQLLMLQTQHEFNTLNFYNAIR